MPDWPPAIALVLLSFALGFACKLFGMPVPAPASVPGAVLLLATASGYFIADRIERSVCGPCDADEALIEFHIPADEIETLNAGVLVNPSYGRASVAFGKEIGATRHPAPGWRNGNNHLRCPGAVKTTLRADQDTVVRCLH